MVTHGNARAGVPAEVSGQLVVCDHVHSSRILSTKVPCSKALRHTLGLPKVRSSMEAVLEAVREQGKQIAEQGKQILQLREEILQLREEIRRTNENVEQILQNALQYVQWLRERECQLVGMLDARVGVLAEVSRQLAVCETM